MLQRSPKSKVLTSISLFLAIVATLLLVDAIIDMRSLNQKYGQRTTFLVAQVDIELGQEIEDADLVSHEMFISDAPQGAFRKSDFSESFIALSPIQQGTIITKKMISSSNADSLDKNERIVFIPTQEKIDPQIAKHTDVIAIAQDRFSADTIASKAKIVFNNSQNIETDQNLGYWIIVTQSEALRISQALSTGDVKLSLVKD